MSRTTIAFLIGAVTALGGLALRLGSHALATTWESLGPNAWGGTTDPAAEHTYQLIGVTLFAFGLVLLALAFCRWLVVEEQPLTEVTTEVLLRFLRACREAKVSGRPGPNVVRLTGRRMDQYAATTINRRLAAISGLFTFATMRDPRVTNPVPKGREARWSRRSRSGCGWRCRRWSGPPGG